MLRKLCLFTLSLILCNITSVAIAKAPCMSDKDCACIAEMKPVCQKSDPKKVGECGCVHIKPSDVILNSD